LSSNHWHYSMSGLVTQEPELPATPTQTSWGEGEVGFSQCRLGYMDDSAWFMAEEVTLTMYICNLQVSKPFSECTAPRLKRVVLTWAVLGWVGWDWKQLVLLPSEPWTQWWRERGHDSCNRCRLVSLRGVFDLMNISELSVSVPAAVGNPLICRAGADRLLTSDINPSLVTRTFMSASVPQACGFLTFTQYWQDILKLLL